MGNKLSLEELSREIEAKGFKLISKYEQYKNISSFILIECEKGHKIQTNLKAIRNSNFACAFCAGKATKAKFVSSVEVPKKQGYRIIGFDNASHNMGVAIFDNGKLVYYRLLRFTEGTAIQRLNKIRDFLEDEIIQNWEPDFIQIESVHHKNNYNLYEVLTKLHGIFEMACDRFGIDFDSVRSSQWRGHFVINSRSREKDKESAIKLVKDMYQIDVNDDVAEAILITKYRSDMQKKDNVKTLF